MIRRRNDITAARALGIALLAACALLFASTAALAAAIGSFTVVNGRVDLARGQDARAAAVKAGDEVFEGDVVRTKSASFAEVTFDDGTVMRLAESSRVEVKAFARGRDDIRPSTLRLFRGKVRAVVPSAGLLKVRDSGARFVVETPTAVAGVRGTDFITVYDFGVTGIYVFKGIVGGLNQLFPSEEIFVKAGLFTIIEPDKAPSKPRFIAYPDRTRLIRATSPMGIYGDAGMYESALLAPETPIAPFELLAGPPLDLPVTETSTSLLGSPVQSGTPFSASLDVASLDMSFEFYTLTISATMSGSWLTGGTWSATVTGTYTDDCGGGCDYNGWSGTVSGTDINGTLSAGVWDDNASTWSSAVSGQKGSTFADVYSGSLSGTFDPQTGTLSGTASGTWIVE